MDSLGMLAALFLAGLGFFFTGLEGIKSNVQQMTSRRFRAVLQRFTRNPALAAFWGMLLGAISQSASAVAFILVGTIITGLMDLRRALLVVTWANLGTVVLVFVAAIDMNLATYALVGVSSLAITFKLARDKTVAMRVLYAVGLLFLGLTLMKEGTVPLSQFPWFKSGVLLFGGSAIAAFLLGTLLRVIIQSSSAIVVVAVQLAAAGLIDDTFVRMVMHGTALGVGLSILLLSARDTGVPRQIALYQALINSAAGITLAVLYAAEPFIGLGFITDALGNPAFGPFEFRMAVGFLAQQSLVVIIGTAVLQVAPAVLARLCPPTPVQEMSAPRYLRDARDDDPGTALLLAEKEQARILGLVPAMLDGHRDRGGLGGAPAVPVDELHSAVRSLHREVEGLLVELVDLELDRETSRQLLRVEQGERIIHELADAVAEFARSIPRDLRHPVSVELVSDLTEGLHAVVTMAAEARDARDEVMLRTLQAMTAERGDLQERIRSRFLSATDQVGLREKSVLYHLTTVYERSVWMVNRLVAQESEGEPDAPAGPAGAPAHARRAELAAAAPSGAAFTHEDAAL
jgi:phosphate:Na+ symporter